MMDIEKIMLGGLVGVTIVVLGQLISKFILDPLQDLKKAIGEVEFNLAFHASIIHTPIGRTSEKSDAAYSALMSSSSNLITKLHAVTFYGALRFLSFYSLPSSKDIERASIQLRGLSTYVHEESDRAAEHIHAVNARVSEIEKLLRLKSLE